MSRAVPLSPDAERLSRFAGLLKATLPLNPLATRPAGIFVTHILNDRIERHFEKLRRESAPHVNWRLFHNTFSLADVAAGRSFIPRRVVDMRLRQAVGHGHFLAGFMDTLLIPLALLARRRYVWVMEYDVDFSGNWAPFFAQFAGLDADLLTTTLNTPDRDPNWAFWPGAVSPPGAQGVRTRAFMGVSRLPPVPRPLSAPDRDRPMGGALRIPAANHRSCRRSQGCRSRRQRPVCCVRPRRTQLSQHAK